MNREAKYTSWPLPEPLTRKVVNYLDVYRLFITLILGLAFVESLAIYALVGNLILNAVDNVGAIEWDCDTSTVQAKWLPAACRP